jgi:hypothetical protein
MDFKKLNLRIGNYCINNGLSLEASEELIKLVNDIYVYAFKSGYSECKTVNFIDD